MVNAMRRRRNELVGLGPIRSKRLRDKQRNNPFYNPINDTQRMRLRSDGKSRKQNVVSVQKRKRAVTTDTLDDGKWKKQRYN
jgi:hypothetical protein